MRFHFLMLVLVLLAGLMLGLEPRDMLVLLFCISLVIVTEMFNTAVETMVDMVTEAYHPLAKLAKDVAAGAVLVASTNAVISGLLIFFGNDRIQRIKLGVPYKPPDVTIVVVVGILVLTTTVMVSKLLTGRSNPGIWHGGVISGHSAIGFFLAMTIIFTTNNKFVAILAILMAAIIAQSRVEARVHSVQEVVVGAVIAIFLTASLYWFMPIARSWVNGQVAGPPRTTLRGERSRTIATQPSTPLSPTQRA